MRTFPPAAAAALLALAISAPTTASEPSLRALLDRPGHMRTFDLAGRRDVQRSARRILGNDVRRLDRSIGVAETVAVVDGRWLVGSGCRPHECLDARSTIAVDAGTGKVLVAVVDEAGSLIVPDAASWPKLVLNVAAAWDPRVTKVGPVVSRSIVRSGGDREVVDLGTVDGAVVFTHNGSEVLIDQGKGLIVYLRPKASLAATVVPGQVLFRGSIPDDGRPVRGTAYRFRNGCPPAPYEVGGGFVESAERPTLILRGKPPRRSGTGCTIVSREGSVERLEFVFLISP